jgi:hypothetical protein
VVEKYKAQSIFENRTTVLPATYFVNKADGKLFVEGLNAEANKEEIRCFLLVAEFNNPSWRNPADEWTKRDPAYCNIPEPSSQTGPIEAVEAELTTNLITGNNAVSTITLSASFPATSGLSVVSVRILKNGALVASTTGANTSAAATAGAATYVFEATDNNGKVYSKSVASTIQPAPATYSNLSCPSTAAKNTLVTCYLNYNTTTPPANIQVYLSGVPSPACSLRNGLGICQVNTGTNAGPNSVFVNYSGSVSQSSPLVSIQVN